MNILPFFLLVVALMYPCCNSFLFKTLINKIKTFFKGKQKVTEFVINLGPEYPGNDPNKLNIITKMWEEYYNCLRTGFNNLGHHKSITPEALQVFEGGWIRLECKVCISPADKEITEDIVWNYRSIPPNGTEPVELGEHVYVSPQARALHIYNLNIDSSGQYFCQKGNTVTAAYFLEVVGSTEPVRMVKPETAPHAVHSQSPTKIREHNLKVFTVWGKWSSCSQCDNVGKRVRYGICTVQLETNETQLQNITNDTHSENKSRVHSIKSITANKNLHYTQMETNILLLFRKGIPCRSFLLPPETSSIPQISLRRSEIMVGFCKVQCAEAIIFEATDEKGNVIETANNSAGIYSLHQGLPSVPPPIERRTVYEDTKSKKAVLRCPGNLNEDIPFEWQIGSKNINPTLIHKESNGRIYINMMDQLIILKPRITDSNLYSCWQNKELAGTIRLIVTEKLHFSFNHHVMLLSIVLTLGTFLIVFYRAFRGRKVLQELSINYSEQTM